MTAAWFDELDRRTRGRLLPPGAAGFEDALRLYTASLPGRPAAVLRARSAADVAAAVTTAAAAGVPLSVRGGGHSGAGFAVAPGGLMLDLGSLRGVRVTAERATERATARAEPGATWGDYDTATQQHGLASTGGIVSTTGVAGLTLGGGIGALRGLHGLAVDNLRAADVVLADGSLVRADATTEPDLFWALRGGGGNFGVVVAFHFDLHPVTQLVTGLLAWPLDRAQEAVAAYRSRAGELPDDVVAEFVFGHSRAGDPVVMLTPRAAGGPASAEPLLSTMRAVGSPEDSVTARSYVAGQCFMDAMAGWGSRHYWHTTTLRHLGEDVVAVLAEFAAEAPSHRSAVIVEHLHGAVSRRDAAETAVGFRHAPYNVFVEAKWDAPADDAVNRDWARRLIRALEPFGAGGAYVNYLPRDATAEQIRDAYGAERFARLRRIKAAYDPGNLFRTNQNIPPAGGGQERRDRS
ncbi:FAD-binding oxidoreductase [Streptomyces sp. MP131-18]|uniref:FAD-binding oxidoreductase n=1 Tax=Streptomyces sp. MP131-18 TaxID=1857892 RepID=UPI00097C01F8|nr:FAD-binding oxidoreductase [Streptomyces sp. MP131-18]ONK11657.1 6-hydroxy-D-nicotine oxidase [Streptomyces sp. MP131-18]